MVTWVWVDSWQQQCCGADFTAGSTVTWTVIEDDGEWTELLLGPEWAAAVRFREDHHDVGSGPRRELRGVVRSICVVTCDRVLEEASPGGPGRPVWMPVPGSGQLRAVTEADPWEPEPGPDRPDTSFDGWLVELDVEGGPPA